MYKLLTPLRSLVQHISRYVIFALLLVLLLMLNLSAIVLGGAAKAEAETVVEKYAASFLCFDLKKQHISLAPQREDPYFTEILPSLPHVKEVRLLAMHTLNSTLGQRMFGAPPDALDCQPVAGRMYQNDGECCINESYARYLSDSVGFTGVGDTLRVYDEENALQHTIRTGEHNERIVEFYEHDMSAEFTVVGILADDATPFHNTLHFGLHRIYTTTVAVEPFFEGIGIQKANGANDGYYLPSQYYRANILDAAAWARPSDDGTHWVFLSRSLEDTFELCHTEISLTQYPPNDGYVALATIDNPANEAEFLNAARGTFVRVSEPVPTLLKNNTQNPLAIQRHTVDGVEKEWYSSTLIPDIWYAARLVDDPASLTAALAPIPPLCGTLGQAAGALSAALILLMTVLLVSERRYEIGVLRCLGVSSAGVCGRFAAEIGVFLLAVSVIGVALGVPAAYLAASALGVGASVSGVPAAALSLLGAFALVALLAAALASALILAKKPMQILNSRT